MSDQYDPAQPDPSDGGGDDNLSGLREAARKGTALQAENDQLKRSIAFTDAGIPSPGSLPEDHPQKSMIAMFNRAYDGELTPEAIKAEAASMGLLEHVVVSDERTPSAADSQAAALQSDFQGGENPAPPSEAPATPVKKQAMDDFHENMKEGQTRSQAAMEYVGAIVSGSVTDDSLFFNQKNHDASAAAFEATRQR